METKHQVHNLIILDESSRANYSQKIREKKDTNDDFYKDEP